MGKGKSPIKVAFAATMYAPYGGGAEQVLCDVAEYLQGDEFSFTVYATNATGSSEIFGPKPGEDTLDEINGIRVIRSPVSAVPFSRRGRWLWRKLTVYPYGMFSKGQYRHLLKDDYDVVLATPFPSFHTYAAFVAAKRRHKAIIFSPYFHLADPEHHRPSLCWMMRRADAVLVQTDFERRFCIGRGVPREKLHKIGVPVRPQNYTAAPGKMKARLNAKELVLFMARLEEFKGIGTVVAAARLLLPKRPACVFALAGSETDYSAPLRRDLPPGLADRVLFLGKVDEADKQALLADADVFVMPSIAESFGIVYLEAWMYEKPVIGARAGAVPDVISEYEDGLLIEPGNYIELAIKIQMLLDHPEWAAAMGKKGKAKTLQDFTQEKIAMRFREVFLKVAQR